MNENKENLSMNRPGFRRSRLTLCIVSALGMLMPLTLNAQETAAEDEDQEVEVIEVSGLRSSLASAVSRKQFSGQIVDSIIADDIGKLPDLNVAEALQRISGVQISRNRGEGSDVAIRGLTQVRTELNGRDIFSTTGGRSLSFEDVPSELLSGVDVYKNPSAEQIEGGIGGLINLRTRKPFDSDERLISATAQAIQYDLRDDVGANLSGLYSDRWDTDSGEFGFLINASFSKTKFREDAVIVEPFYTRTDIPGYEGEEVEVASGGGISAWLGERERKGLAMAAQWAPNSNLMIYSQYLLSKYEFYDPQTTMFGYGAGEGGTLDAVAGEFSFDEQGNLLTGAYNNIPLETATRDATRNSETSDLSIGFEWQVSGQLGVKADLQYIDSSTDYRDATGFGGLKAGSTFYMDLTQEIPRYEVRNTATDAADFLTNPDNYSYTAMMARSAENTGDELAARTDLTWDFDQGTIFRTFTTGARYTTKDINTADSGYDWAAVSGPPYDGTDEATADYIEFPAYYAQDPHQTSFWRDDGAQNPFGPHFVVDPNLLANPEEALAILAGLNPQSGAVPGFTDRNELNSQGEETMAIYAMVDFGSVDDDFYVGNFGVRVVKTDVTAEGTQTLTYRSAEDTSTDIQQQSAITIEQSYTEVLPSFNIRFLLTEQLYWRLAASRGLSRPSFDSLAANFSYIENYIDDDGDPSTPPVYRDSTGTGGNPNLKPLTVDQFDMALEWYFSPGDLAYATLFHKKVKNFQQNGVYDAPLEVPGKGTQQFEVTAPVNGESGTIRGFEVGIQTFFDFVPAPFDGFGVQANYTYVDSEAPSPSATDSNGNPLLVPLEGLSKSSYNLILLYDKDDLSARVAYNWRDDWVITTSGNGTGNLPIYNKDYGQLDASVSYDFTDNLSVTLDAVNLTDETRETYQGFENRPRDFVLNDRRYSLRLRMSF
ncbi:TonB-dependent receptor [Alteromonas pelagimontana]|uniref:TonB-dependent receptor n=1 Tax=Alteromonas pelagimontana TaxID=1858656 RepID=A0A6M4MH75_9ALTE|nr:TonB-dependent receptor [Alteromonas pelagimontana]QJR82278.1 TonB-dependent receptor [Alteromonas pelagimontana]